MGALYGIEYIFFDVGNTLVLPYPNVGSVMSEVLKEYGYQFSGDYLESHLPVFHDFYAQEYERDNSFWAEDDRCREIWVNGYALVLRDVGITRQLAEISLKIYEEFDHAKNWALYDGVIETLATLRERGYRLGVISNWGRGLGSLLDGLEVGAYFDVVISSASVNCHKPEARIFETALTAAGCKPHKAVHIGDHEVADVRGSQDAGMQSILITHPQRQGFDENYGAVSKAHAIVQSMPAVLPYFLGIDS